MAIPAPTRYAKTVATPDPLDEARWLHVTARDRSADGTFVYAVKTTGVYCRPSCPSRQANRANVSFHETPAAAEAAGFRPCRRCHPAAAQEPAASLMQAMAAYIASHAEEPLTLAHLAEQAGMAPTHFQRAFKAALGVSPREYQAAQRLIRFKQALRDGEGVLEAGLDAGFGSTSRIYDLADGSLGMTPSAYRAGGAGEVITHATRATMLGPLMMAATPRGVCFVQFGESEEALLAGLAAEFPKAHLVRAALAAAAPLDAWMAALAAHLENAAPRPDLPLDLRGTAFQISVWRFLMSVKPGDVVSYSELAEGAGKPRAIRAAASACAANRIAVLIPCHRALRADGSLGGYRWGLDRKRALLDAERREKAGSA
ncbi:AraC family transcriptional regulator [Novosphingobium sediminis]|uniref:methylated-DNA--[protein]-cysteine S-methyltransferase n=1 Tax=Novosphingobium sediminis TaxID=707214 RepID=A0A512AL46_9SPHN|nr:bifunctional DNA-binding transcriptional regulator/O6-methylguanine-DNA methyltransferase Ada [Novosphingobium sediminis]GEO00440.1 AraC family transcriptional regulator [Novosphingobium sediminis]